MHDNVENHIDDKVYCEVKECADNGDIRGLRYIFLSCLDVDPTFKKYERSFEDYKNVPGLFIPHTDEGLMPMSDNCSRWDIDYWNCLKKDLMENFSIKRFSHMRDVAKVIYSEKISRIEKAQNKVESITNSSAILQATDHGSKRIELQNKGSERKTECKIVTDSHNDENLLQNSSRDTFPKQNTADEIVEKTERYNREYIDAQKKEELKKRTISEKKALSLDRMYSVILRTETQWFSLYRGESELKITTFGDKRIEEECYECVRNFPEVERKRDWIPCIGETEPNYKVRALYDMMKKPIYYEVEKEREIIGLFKVKSEKNYYKFSSRHSLYEI